jgi:olefin beta-lactone synthetase
MHDSANIARHLPLMAAKQGNHPALKIPRARSRGGEIDYLALSFAELDAEVDAWAHQLTARGVVSGDRVLVMVKQGLPLIAAAFALFKTGAVPIVIDPGMGLKSFLNCVARSRPRVLLGIPLAQIISHIARRPFRTVQVRIPASSSSLARLAKAAPQPFAPLARQPHDLAAILFTSGSTGAPKGVCYEHGMFAAQVDLIRATYAIEPGEIDLPMLPIFALFNPALGMTTIVPEIDPRRPGAVDPRKIVQAIQQERVTNSFGSPTLWNKIADHCIANGTTLPGLRRVLCAGAPVPAALWEKSRRFLPNGQLHSPYGATEALPISTIAADELLPTALAARKKCHVLRDTFYGACVGRPVREVEVKVIALADSPIATLDDTREVPAGDIGEIIVRGPVVTKEYDALSEATAAAKIHDVSGAVWHRMGDCGYFDPQGHLWFCGRKAERVETPTGPLFTEPCEQVFRAQPGVARCALVGLGARGAQMPALVVQPAQPLSATAKASLAAELRKTALQHPHTAGIRRFFFHPSFPVDVRHNAKIHRLTLATWAATAQGFDLP